MKKVVRVQKNEPVGVRMRNGDVAAGAGTFWASVALDGLDSRISLCVRLNQIPAVIRASVVDDDPFPVFMALGKDTFCGFSDDVASIEGRRDDGNLVVHRALVNSG